jgi:hypothetical protein
MGNRSPRKEHYSNVGLVNHLKEAVEKIYSRWGIPRRKLKIPLSRNISRMQLLMILFDFVGEIDDINHTQISQVKGTKRARGHLKER